MCAATTLTATQARPAELAAIIRGHCLIEGRLHWIRDTADAEDANTGYTGSGPQVMATLRNIAISLLHLAGIKEMTRTLQAISRDRTRVLNIIPL
jgi:predicted transposase YbfD/YdcC